MDTLKAFISIFAAGSNRDKVIIITMSILAGVLGSLSLLLINQIIDAGFKSTWLGTSAFITVSLLTVIVKRLAIRKMLKFLEENIARIRLQLTEQISEASFAYVEQLERSEAVTRITIDAKKINGTGNLIIKAFYGTFIFLFSILYLQWLSVLAFGIFVVLFFTAVLSIRFYNPYIEQALEDSVKMEELLYQELEQLMRGFKELKINRAKSDDFFDQRLLPLLKKLKGIRKNALYKIAESELIVEALWVSFIAIFILFSDSNAVSAQVLIIFFFLDGPIVDITVAIPFLVDAKVAAGRINRFQDDLKQNKDRKIVPAVKGEEVDFDVLQIRDLSFSYTDSEGQITYPFGPVNFDIKRHETTFIIGGNGSGKTTFLKLLLGLYHPYSGYFAIDGKKIQMRDKGHWFSAIFSDFYLFNGLYGVDPIDESQLSSLIYEMGLETKTEWLGTEFSNTALSTGQKKRLALVISLMEDKPIYVFDEWAAEQDPEFRIKFYSEILPSLKAKGKTVIVVSHDDRYFHCADHLIKIDNGKVSLDKTSVLSEETTELN